MLHKILRFATVGLVLTVAALVVPDSAVKSTEVALVKVDRADGVDLTPDVVWILAVGSDARPGEDMTRTRGDALQLVGMDTRTGAATAVSRSRSTRATSDSCSPTPGSIWPADCDRVPARKMHSAVPRKPRPST